MGTFRTSVFPSLHNKSAMDIVAREVTNFFINIFPNNFFRYIYIDTMVGMPNLYIVDNGGLREMVKEELQRVGYPRLTVRIKPKENNVDETTFEKMISIYKYPSQVLTPNAVMSFRFFDGDPYRIAISSMDNYTRSDMEFQITVSSKADQEAVSNILETMCKRHYGYAFAVKTEYLLPVAMTDYIKRCVFEKEFSRMNQTSQFMTDDEKKKINEEVQRRFTEYLNRYSAKDIVPYPDGSDGIGKRYMLRRGLRIYLQIDKWEVDEGVKKNNAYENFNLTSTGFYECYHPNSFITRVPTIVRGCAVSKLIKTSNEKNIDGEVSVMLSRESYMEERKFPDEKIFMGSEWVIMFEEKEILFDNAEHEQIPLIEWIQDPRTLRTVELIKKYSTIDEIRKNVKIFVYEERDPVDKSRIVLDEDLNINVFNNDTDKCYYVEVYINKFFMNKKLSYALSMEGEL